MTKPHKPTEPIPQTVTKERGFTRITLEPGRRVVCDDCNDEYTDSDAQGGILFQSKALCPTCAPKWIKEAEKFGEQHLIRGRCPDGKSFADWVREDLR